jgi:hypothetical protein
MIKLLTILSLLLQNDDSLVKMAKLAQKKYNPVNKRYVVIINYSLSIDSERLYLLDMNTSKVVLKTKVSHAKNSGYDVPYMFSNQMNTQKTSLGVYKTTQTYYGKFGYSLKLIGLDSTNSNAEKRAIVFHSNKKMKTKWSWGCFATSEDMNKEIINKIKNGCLVIVCKI